MKNKMWNRSSVLITKRKVTQLEIPVQEVLVYLVHLIPSSWNGPWIVPMLKAHLGNFSTKNSIVKFKI